MAKGDDLIQAYYDSLTEKPAISYEDFKTICQTPFLHIRREMSQPYLPKIRLKYFGSFNAKPSKIVKMLAYTQSRYDKQLITEKTYMQYINLLTQYIKSNPELFKKYQPKLTQWSHFL